jgi:transglutaminase-like putative cysteine protease
VTDRRTRLRDWAMPDRSVHRVGALLATALLLGSTLSVIHYVVRVTGDLTAWLVVVAVVIVAATVAARVIPVRVAVVMAAILMVATMTWYIRQLESSPPLVLLALSTLELLQGRSLLELNKAITWALAVTPAPAFLTWYLAVRRRYVATAVVGAASLTFFILTGDASLSITLLGVIGGAGLLAFGDFERRDAPLAAAEYAAIALAIMIVVPFSVTVVPAAGGQNIPLYGDDRANETAGTTLEGAVVGADRQLQIQGSISLSPSVRYTVRSNRRLPATVATYQRYTGQGWISTGEPRSLAAAPGRLREPPGESRTVSQTFVTESASRTIPTVWRPVDLEGLDPGTVTVTQAGTVEASQGLATGTGFTVTSERPIQRAGILRRVPARAPGAAQARYTQLPDDTPDRVAERTERITAAAENDYERALVIERWLESNRAYSLNVTRPDDHVADAFLFEMNQGYCVYYATTMITMLRTQDIPARFVTGYAPGQSVGDDEYVLRGYNSHAWVQVYFEDVGWVNFDPTPASERTATERDRLDDARSEGDASADTDESENESIDTPTPVTPTISNATGEFATPTETAAAPSLAVTPADGSSISLPEVPSRDRLALLGIVFVGLVAGVRRTGLAAGLYRQLWLRRQIRRDPETDVIQAFKRVMYLLERRHRPRRDGETVRQYLDAVDAGPQVRTVARLRERAVYGPGVDEAAADRAVDLADGLVSRFRRLRRQRYMGRK